MNTINRRIISLILTIIMIVGILPINVLAESSATLEPYSEYISNEIDRTAQDSGSNANAGSVSGDTITILVGDTQTINDTSYSSAVPYREQRWYIDSGSDKVSISGDNESSSVTLVSVKPGTASLRHQQRNGWTGDVEDSYKKHIYTVNVIPKVTAQNISMGLNETYSFPSANISTGGASYTVSYSFANPSVAHYDSNKKVIVGDKVGTTDYTITVTSNGQSGSASGTITVQATISMPKEINLYEGQTLNIQAEGTAAESSAYSYTIDSGTDYASVAGNGNTVAVTGTKPGTASLKTTLTINNMSFNVHSTVNVYSNAVISIDKTSSDLYYGLTNTLKANVSNRTTDSTKQYSASDVVWTIENGSDYVNLSANNGEATLSPKNANAIGKTITVKATVGSETATATVTVKDVKFSICDSDKEIKLVVGGGKYSPACYADTGISAIDNLVEAKITDKNKTYVSDNTSVATVDANGKVTAVSEGTAHITAKITYSGKTYTTDSRVTVSVVSNVKGLYYQLKDGEQGENPINIAIADGETIMVKAYVERQEEGVVTQHDITFESSDSKVAEIEKQPQTSQNYANVSITGHGAGQTAAVYASTESMVAVANITVVSNIESVVFDQHYTSYLGNTVKILTDNAQNPGIMFAHYSSQTGRKLSTVEGDGGYVATYRSSDPSIVFVSNDGYLRGMNEGSAIVTVSVGGQDYTLNVTVFEHVQSISANKTDITLDYTAGPKTYELGSEVNVSYYDTEGKSCEVILSAQDCPTYIKDASKWTSLNPNIVSVDQNGVVTALSSGYATVVVEVEGQSITFSITVKDNGVVPEIGTTMYIITIHYKYGAGEKVGEIAADDYIACLPEGSKVELSVPSPSNIMGYVAEKDICNVNIERLTSPYETTVYYVPSSTQFKVEYYYETIGANNTSSYEHNVNEDVTIEAVTESQIRNYVGQIEKATPSGYMRLAYDKNQKVAADGSTVVAIYYNRKNVLVSLDLDGGEGTQPIYGVWGSTVNVTTPTKVGYTFAGWKYESGDANVFKSNTQAVIPQTPSKYIALWTPAETSYTVMHWGEKLEGGYELITVETRTDGITGQQTPKLDVLKKTATIKDTEYEKITLKRHEDAFYGFTPDSCIPQTILGDGSTIVNVYYNRRTFTVTIKNYNNNQPVITGKYMQDVKDQWNAIAQGKYYKDTATGNQKGNLLYLDRSYVFNGSGTGSNNTYYYKELLTGETPTNTEQPVKTFDGIQFEYDHTDHWDDHTITIEDDFYPIGDGFETYKIFDAKGTSYTSGTLNNRYFTYVRKSYTLTLKNGGSILNTYTYKYGTNIADLASVTPPEKAGYTFAGWYDNEYFEGQQYTFSTMPAKNFVLYAKWVPDSVILTVWSENIASPGYYTFTDLHRGDKATEDPSWSAVSATDGREFIGYYKMDGKAKGDAFTFDAPIYEDTVVRAFFRSDIQYNVVINYKSIDGETLAPSTTDTVFKGDGRTYKAKIIAPTGDLYWFPTSNSHSLLADPLYYDDPEITFDAETETFTYTFTYVQRESSQYTVRYVNLANGSVIEEKTESNVHANIITETAKDFSAQGYKLSSLSKRQETLVLSSDPTQNVITFKYESSDGYANAEIYYYLEDASNAGQYYEDRVVIDNNVEVGTKYNYDSYKATAISGYTFKNAVTDPANGVVTNAGITVKLYFDTQKYSYTVNYLEKDTGKVLHEAKSGQAAYGSYITEKAVSIPGYYISEGTGTISKKIGTENNVFTFKYSESTPTIRYRSMNTNMTVSLAEETVNAKTGQAKGSEAESKAGYTFKGWYSDWQGKNKVSDSLKFVPERNANGVYESAYYYAFWEDVKYTVSYVWNGDLWNTTTKLYDKDGYQISKPTKPAGGEYLAGATFTVDSINQPVLNTEYFTHNAAGQVNGSYVLEEYVAVDANGNPVQISSGELTMPASNVTITGTWKFKEPVKHTLTYAFSWDTSATVTIRPTSAQINAVLPAPVQICEGYDILRPEITQAIDISDQYGNVIGSWSFQGWNPEPETMGTSDTTLTGSWSYTPTKVQYKFNVSYSVAGAPDSYDVPDSISDVPKNKTIEIADTPSIDGYTFSGWSAKGKTTSVTVPVTVNTTTGKNEITMPGENVTVTGSFTKQLYPYTIKYTFDGQEIPGTTENGNAAYETAVKRTAKDITGYTYAGNASEAKSIIIGTGTNVIEFKYYKNVTVKASDDLTKKYGDPDPVLTYTVTPEAEKNNITVTAARNDTDSAGTHSIIFVNSKGEQVDSEVQNNKYFVSYVPGTLTISQGDGLTINTDGAGYEGVYDGKEHGGAVEVKDPDGNTPEGTVVKYSTDNGSTWSTDVPTITHAGEKTVLVEVTNPNYKTVEDKYVLKVTQKSVTVTAINSSKTYGDKDPEFEVKKDGLVGNDDVTVTNLRRVAGESAGKTYDILADVATSQGNYSVTFNKGTFTIDKRTLKLKSVSDKKTYDGKDLIAATVEVSDDCDGFAPNEGATYVVTGKQRLVGESENTFEIKWKANTKAENYEITTEFGTLTVTGSPIDGTKKADQTGELPQPGEKLYFTITVTNTLDGQSDNVVLTEQDGCFFETEDKSNPQTLELGILEPGEVRTVKAFHIVTEDDIQKGTYNNTVTIEGNGKTITVSGSGKPAAKDPKISITKSVSKDNPLIITPETDIIYDITVTNTGNVELKNVTVTDELTGLVDDNKKVFETLPVGESETFTTVYDVKEADIGNTITNVAEVYADEVPVTRATSEGVTVKKLSNIISIKKEVISPKEGEKPDLNEIIRYKITVTNDPNSGITIPYFVINDPMVGMNNVTINKQLKPGESYSIEKEYKVTSDDILDGEVTNQATVSAPNPDNPKDPYLNQGDITKNTADIKTDLTLTKTVKGMDEHGQYPKVDIGDKVQFIITVKNEGNVPYTNVKVVDELLGWTEANPYIIDEIGPGVTYPIPEKETVYTVTSDDILRNGIINVASAEADEIDDPHDPDNPKKPKSDIIKTPKVPTEDIDSTINVVKTIVEPIPSPIKVGSVINYSIKVYNTGNVDVKNIKVVDELTGLEETIDEIKATNSDKKLYKEILTSYTVIADDIAADAVTNTATAVGHIYDPDKPTEEINPPKGKEPVGEGTVTVDTPKLDTSFEITKRVISPVKDKLELGDTVVYGITVKNTGNVKYEGIKVKDNLKGTTPNEWTIDGLEPGETYSEELKTSYVVTSDDILAGGVTNTVTATADKLKDKDGKDITDPEGNPIIPPTGTGTTGKVPTEGINREIEITKKIVGEQKTVALGDIITYEITVTNKGNVPYYNAKVVDEKLNLEKVIAELKPNETSDPITGKYTVTDKDITAGKVENIASVTAEPIKEPTDDPSQPIEPGDPIYTSRTPYDDNKDDPTVINTESIEVDMEVTKKVDTSKTPDPAGMTADGKYKLGSTINYVISIKNTGNAPIDKVTVDDGKANFNKTIEFENGLEVNKTYNVNVEYKVTEDDILRGYAVNEATVKGTTLDGNGKPHEKEVTVSSQNKDGGIDDKQKTGDIDGTIEVKKVVESQTHTPLQAGDEIKYKITVKNVGNVTFNNVNVYDELKAGRLVATIPVLAVNDEKSFTLTYKVTADDIKAGKVTNVATAEGQNITNPKDPTKPITPSGEDTIDTVTEDVKATLKVEKSVDSTTPKVVDVTDKVYYTIKVTNTGNVPYTNITVTDELTGMVGTKAKVIEKLLPNESAIISTDYVITGKDIIAGDVKNVAKAVADKFDNPHYDPNKPEGPTNPKTFVPSDETTPIGLGPNSKTKEMNPDLTLVKELVTKVKTEGVKAGDTLTYKITVTNSGNVDLSNVVIKDILTDEQTTYETLSSGETKYIFIYYPVTDEDIANGSVVNTASGDAEVKNGDKVVEKIHKETGSDPAKTVKANCDYKFTKSVDKTTKVKKGDELTYTLVLENTGNVPMYDVVVKDDMTGFKKTVDVLHAGDIYTWTTKYTVKAEDIKNGTLTNVATIDFEPPINGAVPKNKTNPEVKIDLTKELKLVYRYESGAAVRDPDVYRVVPGESYSYPVQTLNGYHTAYNNATGVMGENDTQIIITYYKDAETKTVNTGNNNGNTGVVTTVKATPTPAPEEKNSFNFVVHYVYEDGRKAADDHKEVIAKGQPALAKSPDITGYEPTQNYVYNTAVSGDIEATVTYKKAAVTTAVAATDTTDKNAGDGATWGEANGYTIEDIEENAVPLAIKDSMTEDCLLHLLLMILALTAQVYYITKKRKIEDEIFELQEKILTLE